MMLLEWIFLRYGGIFLFSSKKKVNIKIEKYLKSMLKYKMIKNDYFYMWL